MLIAVSVVFGFQREISQKVTGFGGHIEILDLPSMGRPDAFPISASDTLLGALRSLPQVASAEPISQKIGLLKTNEHFMGITLKGISPNYNQRFLLSQLTQGRLPKAAAQGQEILVSQQQADKLKLKIGSKVFAYFFEKTIKQRRFTVVGIYESHMKLFDTNIAFVALPTVQQLNNWSASEASVVEIRLHRMEDIEAVQPKIAPLVTQLQQKQPSVLALDIRQHYTQIFSWLTLLDTNIVVILVIMLIVSSFTMISGLLILILERTQTIGTLKALGASNQQLQSCFLYFSAFIVLRGMLIGNILAFALLTAQAHWQFIPIDASTYYISTVPTEFHWGAFAALNFLTLLLTLLALLVPSYMVARISPSRAIKFE